MKRLFRILAIVLSVVTFMGTVPIYGATDIYRIQADYLGEPDCPIGTSASDITVYSYGSYYGGREIVLIKIKGEELPFGSSVQSVGDLNFEFTSPILADRLLFHYDYYKDPFMTVKEAYEKGYLSSEEVYEAALEFGVATYQPDELKIVQNGIEWSFDPVSSTLTVSGSGKKMPDYSKGESPAMQWQYDIKHVVFGDGVYSVGDNAFSCCTNITAVTFSADIHKIGSRAFDDCSKLKDVVFSEGIREVEAYAFADLDKITFNGRPPVLADDLLKDFKGEIFYPSNNGLWNDKIISDYNTDCTWTAFDAPEIEKVENIFGDLVPGAWYVCGIQYCYDRNFINGMDNYRYDPGAPLTREQAAMMLYKYLRAEETYTSYSFTDVKADAWYADAVEWMYRNGYTAGVNRYEFGVGRYVTRQDLMTLVYNVVFREADVSGNYFYKDSLKDFIDADEISDYAYNALRLAVGVNDSSMCRGPGEISPVLYGHKGRLRPKDICTRAEAAAIFQRSDLADYFSPVSNATPPSS